MTGATTWSLYLGAEGSVVAGDARPPVAGPNHVVSNTPHGPVVLGFASGQVSIPASDATFRCIMGFRLP